jgi:hypothetical protein
MAGPVVVDPSKRPGRTFTRETAEDTEVVLGLMRVVHGEPLAGAFAKLLRNEITGADVFPLAHFFEEVSVLVERGHVAEDLVFDLFALDLYWDQLGKEVLKVRTRTGNPKLCEHFEENAEVARVYRASRPVSTR